MKLTSAVIVPVFNRERLLRRALDSIAAQTRRPDELIVVDNNSTDSSFDSAKDWIAAHPGMNVSLVKEIKPGAACARNCGLARATADIVFFFDSDDAMRPGLIAGVMETFEENPEAEIVHWPVDVVLPDGKRRRMKYDPDAGIEFHLFHSLLRTQGYAARRQSFLSAGGWNESLSAWDDWELGMRMLLQEPEAVSVGEVLTDIYPQEESITGLSYHSNIGRNELALDAAESDLAQSAHPRKMRLLRLLCLRRAVLAGLYRREGFPEDSRALLRESIRRGKALGGGHAFGNILRLASLYTSAGLRGAATLFSPFL